MLYIVGLGSAAFMAPGSQVASSKVVRASSADMGLRSTIKGLFNKKQDFLEADPYWETKDIPINTFKNKAPFTSKVVSTKRIVGAKATGETCHIIMDHQGKMPYWEGQSYGVIPPGKNPKNGKPNSVRLYSIASLW
jgi:ferredoxin--NADP+ reductase